MKRVVIIIQVFIFFSPAIFAQIEYEGSVNAVVNTIQFEDGELRYFKYDSKDETLNLFNLDNTLWKSVKLNIPESETLDEIKLVSNHVLNQDDQIEVLYTTIYHDWSDNAYDATSEMPPAYFTLFVQNEKGDVLLEVADGNHYKLLQKNGNKKLLIYKAGNSSGFLANSNINVYALTK